MSNPRMDEEKQLRLIKFLLTEISESEKNLSKKAAKMKDIIENALTQDLSSITPEQQVIFSNALAHYILLAEDANPFHEISLDNINLEFVSTLIQSTEAKIASDDMDSAFRKRAISILWLTFNYEELKVIFTQLKLLNFETEDYLFSPTQRLMKFHLFAHQLSDLLNAFPDNEDLIKAKASLSRIQLRTKAIAAITNDIFNSTDPSTKKTLLKSFSDVFARKIISRIITKVLQKEPSENFGALTIDIRSDIQKELAEVYKLSSSTSTLWKEPENKESSPMVGETFPLETKVTTEVI